MTRTYSQFRGERLPLSLQIEIADDPENDVKRIIILAPLHMQKRLPVPHCYSMQFSDDEILRDRGLRTFLATRYQLN